MDILQSVAEHRRDFPELPQLEFIGTISNFNKYALAKYGFRVRNRRGAFAATYDGDSSSGPALFFYKSKLASKNIKQTSEDCQRWGQSSWWSVGTVKGAYDHEMGQRLENFVKGEHDSVLISLYNQYEVSTTVHVTPAGKVTYHSKMGTALSRYANTDVREFIAEGWSEYRNSASPRPLARQIGERITELYKEVTRK